MKNYVTHLVISRWISVTLTLSSEDEILRGVFYIACEHTRGGKPFGQWPLIFATIFNGTFNPIAPVRLPKGRIYEEDEERYIFFSSHLAAERKDFESTSISEIAPPLDRSIGPAASGQRESFSSRILLIQNSFFNNATVYVCTSQSETTAITFQFVYYVSPRVILNPIYALKD